jgi:hypothetical protein
MPNEQDPEFNMKMEETMKDSSEVPGLEELEFEDKENHPLSLFIMAQTLYTGNNQDGFKNSLQQFMQSIQMHTAALAGGQLNPQNVDGFMQKLELLGETDIQRFKERVNPSEKAVLSKVEEITETEEEQINIVVKDEEPEKKEEDGEKKEEDGEKKEEDGEKKEEDGEKKEEDGEKKVEDDVEEVKETETEPEVKADEEKKEETEANVETEVKEEIKEEEGEKTEDVQEGEDNIQEDN